MSEDDDYVPLIDREREPKSRVHEDLTRTARERLAIIFNNTNTKYKKSSVHFLMEKIGTTELFSEISTEPDDTNSDRYWSKTFNQTILYSDTLYVLSMIEYHLRQSNKKYNNKALSQSPLNKGKKIETEDKPNPSVKSKIAKIRSILITEGILWEIKAEDGLNIRFEPIESEALADVDSEIQALAAEDTWNEALKGYNEAFERYLSGDFDELIPKKLYNSIEAVLTTICVDLEGWTDNRELSHSEYLEMLNENGVYNAHGVTSTELGDLLNALERMVSKVGADRKQRHQYHDRIYSTLLIHQVGAYLYFIINRYEEYAADM
jgi:hypothetical protein